MTAVLIDLPARSVAVALAFAFLSACTPTMTAAERYGGIADPQSFWIHAIRTHEPYSYRFCLAEQLVVLASPELESAVDSFLHDKTDANFHLVAMRYYIETESPEFAQGVAMNCRGTTIAAGADFPALKPVW